MKFKNIEKIFFVLLLMLFNILSLLYADNIALYNNEFKSILPEDIIDVFFPYGKNYLIPESKKAAKFIKKANNFEKAGDYRNAYRYYTIAYQRAKGENVAPFILFKRAFLGFRYSQVVNELTYIYKNYPDFPLIDAVAFELSLRYYYLGNFKKALDYIAYLMGKESPFIPYVCIIKSAIKIKEGMYEEAINCCMDSLRNIYNINGRDLEYQVMLNLMLIVDALIKEDKLVNARILLEKIVGTTSIEIIKQKAIYRLIWVNINLNRQDKAELYFSLLKEKYTDGLYTSLAIKKYGDKLKPVNLGENDRFGEYSPEILGGIANLNELYNTDKSVQKRKDKKLENGVNNLNKKDVYVIQVGSFRDIKNADRLVKELKSRGFSPYIEGYKSGDITMNRVKIGPFGSKKQAISVMDELRKNGINGVIIAEKGHY